MFMGVVTGVTTSRIGPQMDTGILTEGNEVSEGRPGFCKSECRTTKSDPLRRHDSAARGNRNTEVRNRRSVTRAMLGFGVFGASQGQAGPILVSRTRG